MTNKNNIAIAPTYTIKNNKAKNSIPNNSNKTEVFANVNTKENTECIGFVELITINPLIIVPIPNIQNKISDTNILFYI